MAVGYSFNKNMVFNAAENALSGLISFETPHYTGVHPFLLCP
jgi:hypothetical protein